MFWHLYPDLTHMENFRPDPMDVPQYENPPDYHYREKPRWEWWQDLREVASPELGRRAVDAISDHLRDVVLAHLPKGG